MLIPNIGNRMWTMPEANDIIRTTGTEDNKMNLVAGDCSPRTVSVYQPTYCFQSKFASGNMSLDIYIIICGFIVLRLQGLH